jgi:hypothetical protein
MGKRPSSPTQGRARSALRRPHPREGRHQPPYICWLEQDDDKLPVGGRWDTVSSRASEAGC